MTSLRGLVVKTSPFSARDAGSIPGQGAKILHASWPKKQNIKQNQYYNKLNKDFKMVHTKKKFFLIVIVICMDN